LSTKNAAVRRQRRSASEWNDLYRDIPIPPEWRPLLDSLRPSPYPSRGIEVGPVGGHLAALLGAVPDTADRDILKASLQSKRNLATIGRARGITREWTRKRHDRGLIAASRHPSAEALVEALPLSAMPIVIDPHPGEEEQIIIGARLGGELVDRDVDVFQASNGSLVLFDRAHWRSARRSAATIADVPRFLTRVEFAAALGVHEHSCDALLLLLSPLFFGTLSGSVGSTRWTLLKGTLALTRELTRAGFSEWHFSQLSKALAYTLPKFKDLTRREVAALFGREQSRRFFEPVGHNGRWRLAPSDREAVDLTALHLGAVAECHLPNAW
jgi:hypothetical protein